MKRSNPPPPALSAILITPSDFSVLRESISYLEKQSAKSVLELVIVCPSKANLNVGTDELNSFSFVEIVETQIFESTGKALAAGILRANSPIVAYVEEHSFPDIRWAEAILGAHKGDWAAVGWSIENANPGKVLSWASLFADFGPWVELDSSQEMEKLPTHHCSYKKEILLDFGEQLETLLEIETILHNKLKRSGYRLYFESSTKSAHTNISRLSSYMESEFLGGRIFGSSRMRNESWSWTRRLIHILATPLIPFLLIKRVHQDIWRTGRIRQLYPGIWSYLIMGFVFHGFGEMIGYVVGTGDSAFKRLSTELNRNKHLSL